MKKKEIRERQGKHWAEWLRFRSKNFMPNKPAMREAEPDAIDKYILNGWTPEEPFIHKDTRLIAFGSCFAREISKRLEEYGLDIFRLKFKKVPIVFSANEFNTTFTMRQQLEWAFKGWKPDDHLWWNSDKEPVTAEEAARRDTKQAVMDTDVFILTLGLSEIWYNKDTGGVFWYAVPKSLFDSEIHRWKLSTVEENYDNLRVIWDLIKEHNPKAKVVFTLSPVPLKATYRPNSCITSNSVSKAILRVALDQFMRDNLDHFNKDLFYWPSYEIAKEYFDNCYEEDNRHVTGEVVDTITDKFMKYFVKGYDGSS